MRIKIDIKGMDELVGKLNRLNQMAAVRVEDQVKKSARKISRTMKLKVPVGDTGQLKKSIKVKYSKDKLSAMIGPQGRAAWRAHFAEYGTVKQAAQPFAVPAWEDSRGDYLDGMKKALREAVDDA